MNCRAVRAEHAHVNPQRRHRHPDGTGARRALRRTSTPCVRVEPDRRRGDQRRPSPFRSAQTPRLSAAPAESPRYACNHLVVARRNGAVTVMCLGGARPTEVEHHGATGERAAVFHQAIKPFRRAEIVMGKVTTRGAFAVGAADPPSSPAHRDDRVRRSRPPAGPTHRVTRFTCAADAARCAASGTPPPRGGSSARGALSAADAT